MILSSGAVENVDGGLIQVGAYVGVGSGFNASGTLTVSSSV